MLVIEILSATQPSLETIVVLAPGKKPEHHSSGVVFDPATGIEVSVDEIFQE